MNQMDGTWLLSAIVITNLFYTVFIMILVFVINELLLYYQVKKPDIISQESVPVSDPYFSLIYTNIGTEERKYAYYRSTVTHIMFIHLIPISVIMYCVYNAP